MKITDVTVRRYSVSRDPRAYEAVAAAALVAE
jgi:hypothetical protein